jgi:hypothetical protein
MSRLFEYDCFKEVLILFTRTRTHCLSCFINVTISSWGGVRQSPLGTSATIRPIVPAPDDIRWVWSSRWIENWQEKLKYSAKTCPSAVLSTTNSTWPDLGSNLGRRGGKPPTNGLSYMARPLTIPKLLIFQKVSKCSLGSEIYITHLPGYWDRNNCWLLQVCCCSKTRCDWNLVCFDAVGTDVVQFVHSDLSPFPAVVIQHNNRVY